eukprot:3801517-Rhodomonas_salina.1
MAVRPGHVPLASYASPAYASSAHTPAQCRIAVETVPQTLAQYHIRLAARSRAVLRAIPCLACALDFMECWARFRGMLTRRFLEWAGGAWCRRQSAYGATRTHPQPLHAPGQLPMSLRVAAIDSSTIMCCSPTRILLSRSVLTRAYGGTRSSRTA